MANIKQQKKRVLIAQRQRLENLRYKSTVRTMFRTLQDQVNLGDKDAASSAHKELVRTLDRAASRKALHPNTVARKKSRAARLLISEPVKEAKVVRRTKKKAVRPKKETTAAATKAKATKAEEAKAAEATAEETPAEAPVAEATETPEADGSPAEETASEEPAAEADPAAEGDAADASGDADADADA